MPTYIVKRRFCSSEFVISWNVLGIGRFPDLHEARTTAVEAFNLAPSEMQIDEIADDQTDVWVATSEVQETL